MPRLLPLLSSQNNLILCVLISLLHSRPTWKPLIQTTENSFIWEKPPETAPAPPMQSDGNLPDSGAEEKHQLMERSELGF